MTDIEPVAEPERSPSTPASEMAPQSDAATASTAGGGVTFDFVFNNATYTVQVYVRDLYASLVRPVKELKAFRRVKLEPKQRALVNFAIPVDMLNFTNADNRRIVEAGVFELMVGASSGDIRLRGRVEVVGENRVLDGHWRMESQSNVELTRGHEGPDSPQRHTKGNGRSDRR